MAPTIYHNLKDNTHILREGECFCLHGHDMRINHGTYGYYIGPASGPIDPYSLLEIYRYLGIEDKRHEIAESCGTRKGAESQYSPELTELQDLGKFIVKLYELSPYKVGDYVTVLARNTSNKYPFSFTDYMTFRVGKTFKITHINLVPSGYFCKDLDWNGDIHKYTLEGCWYSWHPSMFRKATAEEIAKVVQASGSGEVVDVDTVADTKYTTCGISKELQSKLEHDKSIIDSMRIPLSDITYPTWVELSKHTAQEAMDTYSYKAEKEIIRSLVQTLKEMGHKDDSEYEFHLPNKVKTTIIL